jgi:GTP-binding protein Era
MVKTATDALHEVDVTLFMVESHEPDRGDKVIIELLKNIQSPVLLLINKIDTVKKNEVLPVIDRYSELYDFREIIPVSALKHDGIDILLKRIHDYLPEGPRYYPDDILTDQLERFMATEIIREKIMEMTEEELPYSIAVIIEKWQERDDGLISISCNIYVERDSQKAIIIGKGGEKLKSVGTAARLEIEKLLNTRVFLALWVRVKKNWRNDFRLLKELGYR